MNKKKIALKIGIGLTAGLSITSIVAGLAVSIFNNNNQSIKQNLISNNQPVLFDNKQFNSKQEALEYANQKIVKEDINALNKDYWKLDYNNASYVFEDPIELDKFISKQIKEIKTQTEVSEENINNVLDYDNSIKPEFINEFNIDTNNDSVFKLQKTNVYEANNDNYVSESKYNDVLDENKKQSLAINEAKDSYLNIHQLYYFNGIYFKSKSDLEVYLTDTYANEPNSSSNTSTNNYRKIISPKGNSIVSNPIKFLSDINEDKNSFTINRNNKINSFLSTNAYEYLKVNNTFIPVEDNKISNESLNNINFKDLPIIDVKSNNNKSLYVVDANYQEKYNLFGPYFLNTDGNVSNITNPSLWKETNDDHEQILKTTSIDVLASFVDIFLLSGLVNENNEPLTPDEITNRKIGLTNQNGNLVLLKNNMLFPFGYDDIKDPNNKRKTIYELEKQMYQQLNTVRYNNEMTIYDYFTNSISRMFRTKSYSSFYLLPTAYALLIDNLVAKKAPQKVIATVDEYFISVCDILDGFLEATFGEYILSDYNYLTDINNVANQKFSFKEFFNIGEHKCDFASLPSKINSNLFLSKYKQLFLACALYTRALGSATMSNDTKIKIDSEHDKDVDMMIRTHLAEGINPDQTNPEAIRNNFSKKLFKSSKSNELNSIFDILDIIYKNVAESTNGLENYYVNNAESFANKQSPLDANIVNQHFNEFLTATSNISKVDLAIKDEYLFDSNHPRNEFIKRKRLEQQKQFFNTKQKQLNEAHNEIKDFVNNGKLGKRLESIVGKNQSKESIEKLRKDFKNKNKKQLAKDLVAVDQINRSLKVEKVSNAVNSFISLGGDLSNGITNIINACNNDKYDEKSKAMVIASSVIGMISSTLSTVGDFTPPPADIILKAIAGCLSFIKALIGGPEIKMYKYQVVDSDNTVTNYYWDGGLVINSCFGLVKDVRRDIKDLKMESPIQITNPRDDNYYYYNQNIYNENDIGLAKKDVIQDIINSNQESNQYSRVYSLEPDLDKRNNYLPVLNKDYFEDLYVNNIPDNQNISLGDYIVTEAEKDIKTGSNSRFLKAVQSDKYFNGFFFENEQDFLNNQIKVILNDIKPIYVALLPELDSNGYPIRKLDTNEVYQNNFEPPLPYFESKTKTIINDHNNQDKKYDYVELNPNNYSEDEIFELSSQFNENFKNIFRSKFNVKSKEVSKTSLNQKEKFSMLGNNIRNISLFKVEFEKGKPKYFLSRTGAYDYFIKKISNNDLYDFRIQSVIINYLTIVDSNNNKLYFNNERDFLNWFNQNTKPLKGGK